MSGAVDTIYYAHARILLLIDDVFNRVLGSLRGQHGP
jgi:hypothetical protein